MADGSPIEQRWELMRECLDERQRCTYAAAETKVIGRCGISQVSAATGLARGTIIAGMQELEGNANEFLAGGALVAAGLVRRSGGGRKPLKQDRDDAQLESVANDPKLVGSFFEHPSVAYVSDC